MHENNKIMSLNISNFRGINNLIVNDLSAVNIFVGANNCGKTSVLEALKLMSAPTDIGQMVVVALQRAQVSKEQKQKNLVNYMLSIFQNSRDEDHQKYYSINMSANINGCNFAYEVDGDEGLIVNTLGESNSTLEIAIKTTKDNGKYSYTRDVLVNGKANNFTEANDPIFKAMYFHSSVSYYYSCVVLLSDYIIKEGKKDIIHILQTFDKNIEDISIVGSDIYLFNSVSGSMPLFAYGLGTQKAVLFAAAIVNCKNGVILIDEIDNAIHVSAFEEVFSWLLNACKKYNVQAFITTHSLEAVDAILNTAHESHADEDLLRVITLRKSPKDYSTKCRIRTGEEAFNDREQFRMELRV